MPNFLDYAALLSASQKCYPSGVYSNIYLEQTVRLDVVPFQFNRLTTSVEKEWTCL